MKWGWFGLSCLGALALMGCSGGLPEPVRLDSPDGILDLRAWNFTVAGPVIPEGWLWNGDALWSGDVPTRPPALASVPSRGAMERGGTLLGSLKARQDGNHPAVATAWLTILVPPGKAVGLQIGTWPGAVRVWNNGVEVWSKGTVSESPAVFQAEGGGGIIEIQPRDGRLDLVVNLATSDPMVLHSELNRVWLLGPPEALRDADRAELGGRTFQATFLLLIALIFWALATLWPERKPLVPFVGFLVVCLAKLLVNVEQPQPLLQPFLPGISPTAYLFLNHGLNLLPFPFLVLFLRRQFPEDVSGRAVLVVGVATAVTTVWELLPFFFLAAGWSEGFSALTRAQWSFLINLYVVSVVLFIFERFYHVRSKRRPLSGALFYGGLAVSVFVMLPIPVSYFFPVKFTLFMGWGLFLFLGILGFELIRLQIQTSATTLRRLSDEVESQRVWSHFIPEGWATRLGRATTMDLRPGDRKPGLAIFIQVSSPDPVELWLPIVGRCALPRNALLVDWKPGKGVWSVETWPENALAFALEVQKGLLSLRGLRYRILLTKEQVEFRILDGGEVWVPSVEFLPLERLAQLETRAEICGAPFVLDQSLKEGLVVGGWRRHRSLSAIGSEIELYELEDEALAEMKDRSIDGYESALAEARAGRVSDAVRLLVEVVRNNPFDQPARALLDEWGKQRS